MQGPFLSRDRAASGLLVIALHLAFGALLVAGLGVRVPPVVEERLRLFDVSAPPPPPPPPASIPPPRKVDAPEGEAAPPNIRSTATEVVAPPPVVRLPIPPPIVAAPVANVGSDATQGAAKVPGPGTGAGGEGTGFGAGGSGDGTGSGRGRGREARLIRGRLRASDLPDRLADQGFRGGTTYFRFTIGTDGRVTACRTERSSGNREVDAITCRLFTERFRFRPAQDAAGRPIVEHARGEQDWFFIREEPMIEDEGGVPD